MTRRESINVILLVLAACYGCKKPFASQVVSLPNRYLVVEGLIAAGGDSTIINLSRTVQLTDHAANTPEVGAKVAVDDGQGTVFILAETDTGRYTAPALNLNNLHKYRLEITTTDGQTYVSDYVPVKVTPPIDTVQYQIANNGVNIFASTHDPSNNSRYYRWDYKETYVYESADEADYIFDPRQRDPLKIAVLRTPAQQIHVCYVTANSSAININSSAALSRDVIDNNQITQIDKLSEKLWHRYSILVRQYAMTQDAYNFWNLLKKNTQQIGTVFDVQPSTNNGNIHCTSDPSRLVIGYISASTISRKRIFIDGTELPLSVWLLQLPPPQCPEPDTVCWKSGTAPPNELFNGVLIPLDTVRPVSICYKEKMPSYSLRVAYYNCADCRYHLGGRTQKPTFWK